MKITSLSLASVPLAAAFTPQANHANVQKNALNAEASVSALPSPIKPIFDPLGLYPDNSPERLDGLIMRKELPSPTRPIFDPLSLYPDNSPERLDLKPFESAFGPVSALPSPTKPIFDPLGLYPDNSAERLDGLIKPLESTFGQDGANKEVLDPLRLYSDQSLVSSGVEMSSSLPFLQRPALLDGSLPGDRGFDPFNFASDTNALRWQQKAEIKHARLAMLATYGWVSAELLHKDIASALDLPTLLATGDRVPSILNDGLSHAAFPAFWIATIAAAAVIEIRESVEENFSSKLNPVDMGFDPLSLGGKTREEQHYMQEAELFNGRLGMLAITGFAIQEFFLNSAVVDQIPFFHQAAPFEPSLLGAVFESVV